MKITISFLVFFSSITLVLGQAEDRIRLNKNTFERRIARLNWSNKENEFYPLETFCISIKNNYNLAIIGRIKNQRIAFVSECQVEIHDKIFYIYIKNSPEIYPQHIYGFFTSKSELYLYLSEKKLKIEEDLFNDAHLLKMNLRK